MQATEGLGGIGWCAVAVLLVGILAVVLFGFSAAIYFGLIGTAVALAIMVALCLGDSFGRRGSS